MTEPNAAQPALASRWGDLRVRAISGLVMIVVAIGTAWVGGEVFVLVWLAAAIAVLWEWQRLIGGPALRARVWLGAVALVVAAILARRDLLFEALAFLALYSVVLAWLAGPGLRLWAWGGLVYAGILLVAVIGLRFGIGATAILWLFATVWTTDISAYFGGRLIGGPKLWPRVSPSKTWSGTCVGLAGGALLGTYVGTFAFPAPISVLSIVVVTILASAFSQAGDAGESAMKRAYGVKDSSRLIPGHGGFMDRLDGFIAAAGLALCVFGVLRHFA